MNEETSLWKGSPSQWLNLGPFSLALLFALGIVIAAVLSGPLLPLVLLGLVIPVVWMLWRYLVVRSQVFELTSERLRVTTGIINQHIDEIELYRVKDSRMVRPWWMRLTGLASIELETSDRSMPLLAVPAIHGGVELRELLRRHVELQRDRKRVRELDFEEGGEAHDAG
ncbi:MAG: PH domain-containing protein [Verrucomicrobiaceae bacterium]|nr:MAG: PH domain-containing protein [Verrucomicrobiaceae bacterium]